MIKCKKCGHDIRCKVSLKTEESDRPVEISYQWWYCEGCGARYYGILEDDDTNMFDDRVTHKGYLIEEAIWQESLKWALKCPDEGNTSCKCQVHKDLPPSGFHGESAWYTYD